MVNKHGKALMADKPALAICNQSFGSPYQHHRLEQLTSS